MNGRQETAEEIVARLKAGDDAIEAEQQARFQALREEADRKQAAKAKAQADAAAAKEAQRLTDNASRFDAQHKAQALRQWHAAGKDTESFEAQWPAMRDRLVVQETEKAAVAQQSTSSTLYREL